MDVLDLIKDHEGYRQHVYKDSRGYWTCGYGTLMEKHGPGMTVPVAELALREEVEKVEKALRERLPWFDTLDPVRKAVLIDMGYNLGIAGLFKFQRTLKSIESGEYMRAADEMKQSAWFSQVGRRSVRLCRMMATGKWPEVA